MHDKASSKDTAGFRSRREYRGEYGSVMKNKSSVDTRCLLLFPVLEIGMSNLEAYTFYGVLHNIGPGASAPSRVAPDMSEMRGEAAALRAGERGRLNGFDL